AGKVQEGSRVGFGPTGVPVRSPTHSKFECKLEPPIKARGRAEDAAEARTLLEGKLKLVRTEIESKKPSITQHTNVGHRLARARTKLEKVTAELEEHNKMLDELNARTAEIQARKVAAMAEVAELYWQHIQSFPRASDGDDGDSKQPLDFNLPPGILEGRDAIMSKLATPQFQEFAKMFADHRAAAGGDRAGAGEPRDGEAADKEGAPAPHDTEMGDAFEDETAAE
ncbi:unnamed protein product, partial [Prorocentrum cordatum]